MPVTLVKKVSTRVIINSRISRFMHLHAATSESSEMHETDPVSA